MAKIKIIMKIAGLAAASLALSACELRRDGEVEPEPQASEQPAASGDSVSEPDPAASETPVISIIREDVRPQEAPAPVAPISVTVPFADGGNDIAEEAQAVLREVLDSDALREGWPVILRGHTDSSGNDSANLRASRARAEAVAAWLVERGVDDDRIDVIAFGEQNPIAPNANPDGSPDEEGRARNRRVDIEIAPETNDLPNTGTQSDEDA